MTLVLVHEPTAWQIKGACRDHDPEAFYPMEGDDPEPAKAVCLRQCEVREECLNWAIDRGERWGVWGGMTPRERSHHARTNPPPVRDEPPTHHRESDRFRALRRLRDSGLEAETIARYFGVKHSTVRKWMSMQDSADRRQEASR
jgi:WhiB family redox-sensing transcriptional regulator